MSLDPRPRLDSTVEYQDSTNNRFGRYPVESSTVESQARDLALIRPVVEHLFRWHPIQEWVHAGGRRTPAASLVVMTPVMASLEGHDPGSAEGLRALLAAAQEPGTALDTLQSLFGMAYDLPGFALLTEDRAEALTRLAFACIREPLAEPVQVDIIPIQ